LLGGPQNTIKSHLVFTALFCPILRFLQSYEHALFANTQSASFAARLRCTPRVRVWVLPGKGKKGKHKVTIIFVLERSKFKQLLLFLSFEGPTESNVLLSCMIICLVFLFDCVSGFFCFFVLVGFALQRGLRVECSALDRYAIQTLLTKL
jgi:hypothetical protein